MMKEATANQLQKYVAAEAKRISRLLKDREYAAARQAISSLIDQRNIDDIGSILVSGKHLVTGDLPDLGDDGKITIDRETLWEVGDLLRRHPTELLNLPSLRSRLSRQRRLDFVSRGRLKMLEETDNVIDNAVAHNAEKLEDSADDGSRPQLLIGPLAAIDYVASHKKELSVLTIGSRSESELFCLYAAGFSPENIKAVDLISYSPLIQAGDAHQLPFPDSSFDIVLAGWILAYSKVPKVIASEIMRVAKPHAYVAVGCAYTPPARSKRQVDGTNISGSRFSSIADITELFQPRLAHTLFQSPIERDRLNGSASLAAIIQLNG